MWKSLSGPFDALLKRIDRHVTDIDNIARVEEMKANIEGRDMIRLMRDGESPPQSSPGRASSYQHLEFSIIRASTIQVAGGTGSLSRNSSFTITEEPGTMFRVPALLHPKFTGREDEIVKMRDLLLESKDDTHPRRIAIYGLPGAGKTQLALKYAYENRKYYPQVFHAFASKRENLAIEYAKWVHSMNLGAARGPDQEQKVDAMKDWFQNNDNWLLILDNVAGPGVTDFPITDFLPVGSTGTIIFTTRNEFIAKSLAPEDGAMLLERMNPHDAIDLILKTAGIKAPTEEVYLLAKEIQEELGGLPIALEQAGTAMNDLDGTLTPREYLDRLKSNKIELLSQPNGFSITGSDTVSVTFNRVLEGCSPDAILLLELFSFLDPEGIPTDLLREGVWGLQLVEAVKRTPTVISVASPPLKVFSKLFGRRNSITPTPRASSWNTFKRRYSTYKKNPTPPSTPPPPPSRRTRITALLAPENLTTLERVIRELKSSSLLRLNRRNYWLHDLVREFAFKRLNQPALTETLSCVIDLVAAAFPLIDSEDQRTNNCNKYRTTAKAVISITEQYGGTIDTPALWELKHRLARHFWHLGLHDQAEPLVYAAYQRRKERFGERHELTLASASLLGNVWVCWPREDHAVIPFWEEVCRISEEECGAVSDFTLENKRVLCICYRAENELEAAERMIKEQITLVRTQSGEKSEMCLRWRNDLTIVLHMQDKIEEVDSMSLGVWKDCFETLGNDHKVTVCAFDTRTSVLGSLGRWQEVAGDHIIACIKNTAIYGAQHPDACASEQASIDTIWYLLFPTGEYDPATIVAEAAALETAVIEECRKVMEFSGDKEALGDFESYEASVKRVVKMCLDCGRADEVGDQQADSGYEEGEGGEESQKVEEKPVSVRRNSA